jgi:hypothetical protein
MPDQIPDGFLPPKKSSGRGWKSFFGACLIFWAGWFLTGHSLDITDAPWWSFLLIIVIQAIIQTVWGLKKPAATT